MIKTILTNISLGITYGILIFIISIFTINIIYSKTSSIILTLVLHLIIGLAFISFFINIFNWYLGAILLLIYMLPIILLLYIKYHSDIEDYNDIEDYDTEYKLKR